MACISLGVMIVGAIVSAAGQMQQAHAASQAAKYNAAVAQNNANIATQNAQMANAAGEQKAAMQEQKTRAEVGQITANQAASGIDVNKGSAVDVRSSAAENGELDAITIRSNAAREAYGYQTQSQGYNSQAELDKSSAKNDMTAGEIGAAGSFLGSAGKAGQGYTDYQNKFSLNSSMPDSFANASDGEVNSFISATS